jgi:hypothetical protein
MPCAGSRSHCQEKHDRSDLVPASPIKQTPKEQRSYRNCHPRTDTQRAESVQGNSCGDRSQHDYQGLVSRFFGGFMGSRRIIARHGKESGERVSLLRTALFSSMMTIFPPPTSTTPIGEHRFAALISISSTQERGNETIQLIVINKYIYDYKKKEIII